MPPANFGPDSIFPTLASNLALPRRILVSPARALHSTKYLFRISNFQPKHVQSRINLDIPVIASVEKRPLYRQDFGESKLDSLGYLRHPRLHLPL
ncbi:atp-binding protein fet5 [Moniliophthora roreri]|nr:atp-binding protein fet5 [Moniliophthora roreri]